MNSTPGPAPEPQIDEEPDPGNEAGGPDAVEEETSIPPLTPDVPLSAQLDDEHVPDEIQEPESPDSEANVEDPSVEPSA